MISHSSDTCPEVPGHPPVVLTIAGFDPSSGAGVTADLKVFAAHGLYGISAITALTVQSTAGVRRSEAVSSSLLAETLACLAEDLPIAGVKIGMLGTSANVGVISAFLERLRARQDNAPRVPVVLDPVLRSSSGHPLLDPEGLARMRQDLLPLVDCITPNSVELLLLANDAKGADGPENEENQVMMVAAQLRTLVPELAIIATGGHLTRAHDLVLAPGAEPLWIRGEWVRTRSTHGTGCAHSSAILCSLVAGRPIDQAAHAAKEYVTEALRAATPMGLGGGSMHHLYRLRQGLDEGNRARSVSRSSSV